MSFPVDDALVLLLANLIHFILLLVSFTSLHVIAFFDLFHSPHIFRLDPAAFLLFTASCGLCRVTWGLRSCLFLFPFPTVFLLPSSYIFNFRFRIQVFVALVLSLHVFSSLFCLWLLDSHSAAVYVFLIAGLPFCYIRNTGNNQPDQTLEYIKRLRCSGVWSGWL